MYKGVKEIFAEYWGAYGGGRALARSPYLHLALVLLAVTYHFWATDKWWTQVISVLPNLLGFTLGGFAVFLGFGDEKFRALLAEADEETPHEASLYLKLCATFVHFILVQVLALLCAVVANASDFVYPWSRDMQAALVWARLLGGAVGYGIFLYALTSVLAATMHVFRIAVFYEQHQRVQAEISARKEAATAQPTAPGSTHP